MNSKLNRVKEGEGWIYVVTHKGHKGLVKIGYSTKVPEYRIKEILKESPYPCIAEYRALVSNAYLLEKETHSFLSLKRENKNREWFSCSVKEAQEAIQKVAGQQNIEIILSEEPKTRKLTKLRTKAKQHIGDIFEPDIDNEEKEEEIEKIWAIFLKRKDLAFQGNSNAQYELAFMYQLGEGVKRDIGKAVEWYEKSAKQGHIDAQVNLGKMLCSISIHKNYDKAKIWFEKAAKQNNADAYYYLANMYQHGYGVKQDLKQAEDYYFKAIEYGDDEMKKRIIRSCLNRNKISNL